MSAEVACGVEGGKPAAMTGLPRAEMLLAA